MERCLFKVSVPIILNTFPFNSKSFDCPLGFWLVVPLTPESKSLKKMAISIPKIVPHTAGVEGLFSLMNAMETKIKLHLLQGDPLLGQTKFRKKSTV
ncbi:hypothetical protein VP01_21g4 [Puccinia sorghi]|uniref:Uncharacterized protein n=1 Tax=Puccinia sorghi TaxID=27349 RepID=A0A0L6V9L3_9BASI|nr:hypothetical protein VP01_21g4 [Puccinia sorghi]